MSAEHALASVLRDAAEGRFPKVDGGIDVLPPDVDGTLAVVAFTGHAYVLADVDPLDVAARAPDGGFGSATSPAVLSWLADPDRDVGSTDVVLVRRATGRHDAGVIPTSDHDEHPRVRRARAHRRDVTVLADGDGVVTVGTGLVGRQELSVELFDPEAARPGAGRRLIDAGLGAFPEGSWCWAQVAAGNARSLRAFLACGFRPVCGEVLITTR